MASNFSRTRSRTRRNEENRGIPMASKENRIKNGKISVDKGASQRRPFQSNIPVGGGTWGGNNKSTAGNSLWRVGSIETFVAYPNPAMENRTMDQGIVSMEEELSKKEFRERMKEWDEERECARRIADASYDGHHSENESTPWATRPTVEELITKLEAKDKQQRVMIAQLTEELNAVRASEKQARASETAAVDANAVLQAQLQHKHNHIGYLNGRDRDADW